MAVTWRAEILEAFLNAPNRIVISEAKFAKPGKPIEANAPNPNVTARNGTFPANPPILERLRVFNLSLNDPHKANKSAIDMP